MLSIYGRNINEVYHTALLYFSGKADDLIESNVRGERRLQYAEPIASTYTLPRERVLFDKTRDANPFFHFMESLWIIAGRNDVAWLKQWLPGIANYSDNGMTFHGAYGERLLRGSQMDKVLRRLKNEEDTTRAVLQIYDHNDDVGYMGKDMPCNDLIFLGVRGGQLNITVCCRSNDMIKGAYGANVVQFSMLQEYMADRLGCNVGTYTQMSNNAHVYPDHPETERALDRLAPFRPAPDPYADNDVEPYPLGLMGQYDVWWDELSKFMYSPFGAIDGYRIGFFEEVAKPMALAHQHYRNKNWDYAFLEADAIAATDWRLACIQWLQRRQLAAQTKAAT